MRIHGYQQNEQLNLVKVTSVDINEAYKEKTENMIQKSKFSFGQRKLSSKS